MASEPVIVEPPPSDALDLLVSHFKADPWAASLLCSPEYNTMEHKQRSQDSDGRGFFVKTLNTEDTVPRCIMLVRRDRPPAPLTPPERSSSTRTSDTPGTPPDLIYFFQLGGDGITSHRSVAHGGLVCTLFDEAMGASVALQRQAIRANNPAGKTYTLEMNVRFRGNVIVPGLVAIRTWCVARVGEKIWLQGDLLQASASREQPWVVKAEATSFWFTVGLPRTKL